MTEDDSAQLDALLQRLSEDYDARVKRWDASKQLDGAERSSIAEQIGRIGDLRALMPLIKWYSRSPEGAYRRALESLRPADEAIALFRLAIKSGEATFDDLGVVLGAYGEAAAPVLIEFLMARERGSFRVKNTEAGLKRIKPLPVATIIDGLRQMARYDRDHARSCGSYTEARDMLIRVLTGAEASVTVPLLLPLLWDMDYYVRQAAGTALEKIGWKPVTAEERVLHLIALRPYDSDAMEGEGSAALVPLVHPLRMTGDKRDIAVALKRLGWQPGTPKERALFAAARWDYASAMEEGALCAEALVFALTKLGNYSDYDEEVRLLRQLGTAGDDALRWGCREQLFAPSNLRRALKEVAPEYLVRGMVDSLISGKLYGDQVDGVAEDLVSILQSRSERVPVEHLREAGLLARLNRKMNSRTAELFSRIVGLAAQELNRREKDAGESGESSKMLVFSCTCGRRYRVKAVYAGKKAKCSACGAELRLPPRS